MARYIDADALGEVVVIVNEKPVVPYWAIKEMKGEDVAPVKHAHWEEYYGDDKCTSCGFVCGDSFYLGSASFCPHCGAKMDEVTE